MSTLLCSYVASIGFVSSYSSYTIVQMQPRVKEEISKELRACPIEFFIHTTLRTTQRLVDRIKQHVPTSIRKKCNTVREQPPRLCKNNNSKINCESAIGQHLLTNPECAKTYTDDNFRIIGQARSSFHLSVLESVYIKTQNPVLCEQKDFIFSLGIFK